MGSTRDSCSGSLIATDVVSGRLACTTPLGLFDHRPPARADRYETCATELVWKHLSESGRNVEALVPLVNAVRAGDSPSERGNSAEYAVSRQKGVHAVVARLRGRGASDRETWTTVRRWLNQYRLGPSPT